ncbi:MAG: hypothetical protein US50_C0048G0001 [Candidatus Nomurabacteria bacterium GW2011_GWB1_37_5]|uniref:Uncharacterized protein n=1 Tax=Candidatus Nomurabacteria bacterium GW2011_GWB1_37_5 TaxID=1618742 RepID=A0A0G0JCE1_9BACT|nr:MAG: hypothetical protein US50_C0048G0001 [Candidatus Nomurabacteria bacterium GW2011_GWB1_37_5]
MNTEIKLILPNNNKGVVLDLKQGERLYFLAGPIRGGGDWQAKAIRVLNKKDPFCYIACPCRYDISHELSKYQLKPTELPRSTDDEREWPEYALDFPSQTMWERYYLEHASWFGSIIFWLPCENKENPRKKEDGPYARDTYGELGRWSIRSKKPDRFPNQYLSGGSHLNLVVGGWNACLGRPLLNPEP